MRIVVDTNVFVSALMSTSSPPWQVVEAWHRRELVVLVSEALLDEYRRVLSYERVRAYLRVSDRELDEVFQQFERHGIVAVPSEPLHVVDDPADNIVLECAIAGAADFIVSGDIHLLALGEYEGVRIIRPRAFVDDVLAAMRHDP